MKIALIGYGKMGKAIEEIAISRGHSISHKISSQNPLENNDFSEVDVAIEFTRPELAVKHINFCLGKNIPIIVGTTAWQDKLEEVKKLVASKNGSLLYASNFSVGVNIFFELNKKLAVLMSGQESYHAELEEIHHVQKLDAPSGTAVSIANDIIDNHQGINNWQLMDYIENISGTMPVIAKRVPDVPGTHEVSYVSDVDTISIKHVAHNRKGFALGAVIAAEFLKNKSGIFTMSDVLKF
jgi:4-hydroxy-tetrahydrodipicolinate reductase